MRGKAARWGLWSAISLVGAATAWACGGGSSSGTGGTGGTGGSSGVEAGGGSGYAGGPDGGGGAAGGGPACGAASEPCCSGSTCSAGLVCRTVGGASTCQSCAPVGLLSEKVPLRLGSGHTYYVSSSAGNDDDPGTQSRPWKSLNKVSTTDLSPGDNVLFKAGDQWIGSLRIHNSGASSDPIVFSSYGNGARPLITLKQPLLNWNDSSKWTESSANVWQMDVVPGETGTHTIRYNRLWLNGVEYATAGGLSSDNLDGTSGVNPTHPFYDAPDYTLYVYAPENPATYYSEIEVSGRINPDSSKVYYTVTVLDADYVTIDSLDIEGGLYSAIGLAGADHVTVQNSAIGKYSGWAGIAGQADLVTTLSGDAFVSSSDPSSDDEVIQNDVIDSDFTVPQHLQYSRSSGDQYGISASSGASRWEIKNNLISHFAMNVLALQTSKGLSQGHSVHNNEMTSPNVSWGKTMQVESDISNMDQNVKFYDNYVHDIPSGLQISSNNNSFYFNVFSHVYGADNVHATQNASDFAFQFIRGTGYAEPSKNEDFNNTFYEVAGDAILWAGSQTLHANDLYVDSGKLSQGLVIQESFSNSSNTWENNLFFRSGASSGFPFILNTDDGKAYSLDQFAAQAGTGLVVSGNSQHTGSVAALIDAASFGLPAGSPAAGGGTDISALVPSGFEDLAGNHVVRSAPSIGAVQGDRALSCP